MPVGTFVLTWGPVIISLVALGLSFYNSRRGDKKTDEKEIKERVARETRIDMKLDEISKDIKEIKETVKNIQNDVKDHEGRIVKLEASLKAEHKRLDDEHRRIDEIFVVLGKKEGGESYE